MLCYDASTTQTTLTAYAGMDGLIASGATIASWLQVAFAPEVATLFATTALVETIGAWVSGQVAKLSCPSN